MKAEKILKMINNNEIKELKKILQDEIYISNINGSHGRKKRYAAMKRYFNFCDNNNYGCTCPYKELELHNTFLSGKYNSFINGCSIVLIIESIGGIIPFNTEKAKYFDVEKMIDISTCNYISRRIDFNDVLARAKSKGYKYKKSEVVISYAGTFEYIMKYKPSEKAEAAYFKIGILDQAFSIINDGNPCDVYYINRKSPLFIKSSIGLCMILPLNADEDIELKKETIEAMEI